MVLMKSVIELMLEGYETDTLSERKNAIKEIVQEIVLCGLSRGGFFNKCAFYGGTALRIFHNSDRFSENLDFSLIDSDCDFDLTQYFAFIEAEANALGLNFTAYEKEKNAETPIKSAFLKGNTKEVLFKFDISQDSDIIHNDEVIKIKFEVDTDPAPGAKYKTEYGLLPAPYAVRLYDLPSLFAGKIHACLCRKWKNRVKGRDFYDYVFFLSMGVKVNMANLKAKLVQSDFISESYDLTVDSLKGLLGERFEKTDFDEAKKDVLPFVKDPSKLNLWSKEFFTEITKRLESE